MRTIPKLIREAVITREETILTLIQQYGEALVARVADELPLSLAPRNNSTVPLPNI